MKLDEYIDKYYSGNKSEFARVCGVPRQKITKWLASGFIVVDGKLYSPRRDIPENGRP